MKKELHSKLTYLLLGVLFLTPQAYSLNLAREALPYVAQTKQNKLIFGTTNGSHTLLFKQADLILTHAFAQLGYQFSLVNLPNKRNLLWANEDKIDGIAFRVDNFENIYANLVRVNETIFSVEQWVYSKKTIDVDGWENLYPYTVAYEQGTLFIEENKDYFQYLMQVSSTEQAFELVYKDRADFTITSKSTGDLILKHHENYKGKIMRQSPALVEIHMFSYLHQKHQAIAIKLAEVLKVMKENGEYNQLIQSIN
ncbi:substrate-binding periplasmic protein [Thalassotalea piscium]|uniref:ABC-type amino acid transport substrate-binding protein n=1 Tax=Thalassotalea piscium TaxID=1230533 RepID=A0A7X0NK59_9GAMM|nr:transporter substrate-binding domain-containing protein [Thalassotalea piscium]MBB6544898.1 ABC-type amino acid transport substrate-binding protein [Thalassotalea piscium]